MAVEIPLSRGLVALVDDADAEWLSQWKWSASTHPSGRIYAFRKVRLASGKRQTLYLHKLLCEHGADEIVDHRNNDSLDNRRFNLRACTRFQNMANAKAKANTRCGLKGVTKQGNRFRAQITIDGQYVHIGWFTSAEAAHQAYCAAALQRRGEFARVA